MDNVLIAAIVFNVLAIIAVVALLWAWIGELKESFRTEINRLIRHGDRVEDRIAELEAKNGAAELRRIGSGE